MKLLKCILKWQFLLGLVLLGLSAAGYFLHYLIFRDAHHIFIYLLGDIAFVFIEVLLVTLIIHQLLSARERRALLGKLNMVIGVFFIELGNPLLRLFAAVDPFAAEISGRLVVKQEWGKNEFERAQRKIKSYNCNINSRQVGLAELQHLLSSKRQFLLGLLENPNLLEHESFSNLLLAVFHLNEELACRRQFDGLPDKDYEHLSADIKRIYSELISEWLEYMRHLKSDYPYLFSLAVRTNPFDPSASAVIR